jgi:hypothetical protein
MRLIKSVLEHGIAAPYLRVRQERLDQFIRKLMASTYENLIAIDHMVEHILKQAYREYLEISKRPIG